MFGIGAGRVWREFAEEIGATYEPGGFRSPGVVKFRIGSRTIVLEAEGHEIHSIPILHTTRFRVSLPHYNLQFNLGLRGPFSRLGRRFGVRWIATGDQEFDETMALRGSDPERLQEIFANPTIRLLALRNGEGVIELKAIPLPEKNDADSMRLEYHEDRLITDKTRLKELILLISEFVVSLGPERAPDG